MPATIVLLPKMGARDATVDISAFKLNDPTCATSGTTAAYQIATGTIGSVVAAGTSTPLVVNSGFASIGQTCGNDECTPSVDRISLALKDQTVAGNSISGVTIENVASIALPGIGDVDSGLHSIPKGGMTLLASGLVNGMPAAFVLQNNGTFLAGGNASTFGLQGALDTMVTDATGHLLPVSIPVSVTGTPASAQVKGCLALSGRDRLFGFEDAASWTGTNAILRLVATPITQGCAALGINGQGYVPFTSAIFNTTALSVKVALSVDLFIPQNQPNPSWLGALQMYLTCPEANIFNQYIGQAELTGHPRNAFSTLRYPLPSATLSTLSQTLDCSFGFALNVNQTNQTWILDNLRFTP
jgi:hypothetical protein